MASITTTREWERSVWIARDPSAIWSFLVDLRNDSLWRPDVLEARWISPPPYGAGSTGLHVLQEEGPRSWEVSVWQEPLIWKNTITSGRFRGGVSGYHIQPDQTGSRVTLLACPPSGIVMRVRAPFMKGQMIHEMESHLDRLKTLLEA